MSRGGQKVPDPRQLWPPTRIHRFRPPLPPRTVYVDQKQSAVSNRSNLCTFAPAATQAVGLHSAVGQQHGETSHRSNPPKTTQTESSSRAKTLSTEAWFTGDQPTAQSQWSSNDGSDGEMRGSKVPLFCYCRRMTTPNTRTKPLSAADAKEQCDFVHRVISGYSGPAGDLEAALGMFLIGRYFGWRALFVMHSKKTVAKYETILGIEVQEAFEPEGPDVNRAPGYQAANSRPSFWRVVSGEDPIERKERQRIE